jgi:hypothetical protein
VFEGWRTRWLEGPISGGVAERLDRPPA